MKSSSSVGPRSEKITHFDHERIPERIVHARGGDFPEWELSVQAFDQKAADKFQFDILDATKLIPEEMVPLTPIGKMVMDRNPDNFLAETEHINNSERACYKCLHSSELSLCSTPPGPADALLAVGEVRACLMIVG